MKFLVVKRNESVSRGILWLSLTVFIFTVGCKVQPDLAGKSSLGSASHFAHDAVIHLQPADSLGMGKPYGYAQGTTGGNGANAVVITHLSDSGEGSLRSYLENPSPMHIKFSVGLKGVIYLSSSINMKGNKTLDGSGSDITISPLNPNSPDTAIKISDQSNIIISDLSFDGRTEKWDRDREGADGINIKNSTKIWIHHCHFRRWIDGGIDIVLGKNDGISSDISLTSNRFEDIYQGLLLVANKLTFARNYCFRVRTRCVKVIKGDVHSFNNIIEDWGSDDIQYAKAGGQILSEGNVFLPKKSNRINREDSGKIQMFGNRYKGGVKVIKNSKISGNFLKETGSAQVVRCQDDAKCWSNLERELISDAGKRVSTGVASSAVGN